MDYESEVHSIRNRSGGKKPIVIVNSLVPLDSVDFCSHIMDYWGLAQEFE